MNICLNPFQLILLTLGWSMCNLTAGAPSPTIALTGATDGALIISVVPTTYGITRHEILRKTLSLTKLAITGGVADPVRNSGFDPPNCYDGSLLTYCTTNSGALGNSLTFHFAAAFLNHVKITKKGRI